MIGHLKSDGHLGRNYLAGRHGDHLNAVLTAIGYNFRLVFRWPKRLLRAIVQAILATIGSGQSTKNTP